MWIMMNDSFLSIVCKPEDTVNLTVRARRKEDILRVFPKALVVRSAATDYRYRAKISRHVVAEVVGERILNIQYDNFKDSVVDAKRYQLYTKVWATMTQLEERNK